MNDNKQTDDSNKNNDNKITVSAIPLSVLRQCYTLKSKHKVIFSTKTKVPSSRKDKKHKRGRCERRNDKKSKHSKYVNKT